MKRILLTLCLFVSLFPLLGQSPINVGIKFGANSSSLITDFNEFFDKSEINYYFAGAFVKINIGRIYLQPEVYFNTKGGEITPANSTIPDIPDFREFFRYQTIDIPILLGINIINKPLFNLRVCAGPVLSFITGDPIISDFSSLNINDLKDNYVGIQAGAGFDIWFFTFDARVENSFNIFSSGSNFSASNRVYLFSVGIKLF